MHNVNNHSCFSIPERLKGRVLGSCEWPEGFLWCFLVVDNLKREGLKKRGREGEGKGKRERERGGGREGGREREGDEKNRKEEAKKR